MSTYTKHNLNYHAIMFSWPSSSGLYKTIGILDDEELLTVYQRPETRELFDDRIHNKKKHWNAIYRSTSCNLDICDFFGMFIHTSKIPFIFQFWKSKETECRKWASCISMCAIAYCTEISDKDLHTFNLPTTRNIRITVFYRVRVFDS